MVRRWLTKDFTSEEGLAKFAMPETEKALEEKPEQPPMDIERALEEFVGQGAVLRNVLSGFLSTAQDQMEKIKIALAAEDAETVRKEAHAIKGGAGNLTADTLSAIAHRLEKAGASKDLENGTVILDQLAAEFTRLSEYVAKTDDVLMTAADEEIN